MMAEQSLLSVPREEVVPRVAHGALSFVVLTLDYALMLAAMTFNVGIFFAVVTGLTLGLVLFRPCSARATERATVRIPAMHAHATERAMVRMPAIHAHGRPARTRTQHARGRSVLA
jgi:hypothetical protein